MWPKDHLGVGPEPLLVAKRTVHLLCIVRLKNHCSRIRSSSVRKFRKFINAKTQPSMFTTKQI